MPRFLCFPGRCAAPLVARWGKVCFRCSLTLGELVDATASSCKSRKGVVEGVGSAERRGPDGVDAGGSVRAAGGGAGRPAAAGTDRQTDRRAGGWLVGGQRDRTCGDQSWRRVGRDSVDKGLVCHAGTSSPSYSLAAPPTPTPTPARPPHPFHTPSSTMFMFSFEGVLGEGGDVPCFVVTRRGPECHLDVTSRQSVFPS